MDPEQLTSLHIGATDVPIFPMGAPRVALVSRPQLAVDLDSPDDLAALGIRNYGRLPSDQATAAETLCELGGRRCYESFNNPGKKSTREYLHHILSLKHGSVLEHAYYVFHLWRISRGTSHELVRHRAGTSFSQLSTRYVDHLSSPAVEPLAIMCPPAIWDEPGRRDSWLAARQVELEAYKDNVDSLMEQTRASHMPTTQRRKHARQTARSGLPIGTETRMQFGANIRALLHILNLRGSEGADFEIRAVAVEILRIMRKEAPIIFDGFEIYELPDGGEAIRSPWGKP